MRPSSPQPHLWFFMSNLPAISQGDGQPPQPCNTIVAANSSFVPVICLTVPGQCQRMARCELWLSGCDLKAMLAALTTLLQSNSRLTRGRCCPAAHVVHRYGSNIISWHAQAHRVQCIASLKHEWHSHALQVMQSLSSGLGHVSVSPALCCKIMSSSHMHD